MESDFIAVSFPQVVAGLVMIALGAGLAYLNRSGLERQYLSGAVRSFIQLWLVGYFLVWLFDSRNPVFLALTVEFQIIMGAWTSGRRQEEVTARTYLAIGFALHCSVMVIGAYLYGAVLRVNPFLSPHLLIPLMGMVIGNSANAAALSVHRLRGEVKSHRGEIETALALGATPGQAMEPYIAATMRNALIPSLNSMMLMGIVQLPGIMSGQIIGGIVPEQAVRYQIIVVYMLAGAVALACHLTVKMEARSLFTKRWALLSPAKNS